MVFIVSVTFLASAFFIVIANVRLIKGGLDNLDFRNVVTQLVALTAWVAILSKALLPINPEKIFSDLLIFVTSLIMGGVLIHNLSKEVMTRKEVNTLIKKLEENNDKLRELDEQKSEFVSLASHQLRGPLSIIRGYVSMIIDGDYGSLSPESMTILRRIFQTCTGMNFLINDYLDVSKLDKGEMEYVLQDVRASELLDEVVRNFVGIAKQKNVFLLKKYAGADDKIRVDQEKTKQIISNVIDNSLKYTEAGSITIDIKTNSKNVTISITDTGIGIPENKLVDIFGKFNRTKEAINLSVVGTGLGLYVAKIMTEAQNGKIWAKSDGAGTGATFYIQFPLAR